MRNEVSMSSARLSSLLVTLWLAMAPGHATLAAEAAVAPAGNAGRVLTDMAEFLATASALDVTVKASHDAMQADGTHLEFSAERRIKLVRPDRLRIESRGSDGTVDIVTFDGRTLTSLRPAAGVYAQTGFTGDVDGAIVHFVRDLRMRLPLAMLLLSKLPDELNRRVTTLTYVDKTVVDEQPVHHIAGSTDSVDFEVWIRDGREPVPVRVVITYRGAAGQPGFRADLVAWHFAAPPDNTAFDFTPPPQARRVAFLDQVQAIAANPEESAR